MFTLTFLPGGDDSFLGRWYVSWFFPNPFTSSTRIGHPRHFTCHQLMLHQKGRSRERFTSRLAEANWSKQRFLKRSDIPETNTKNTCNPKGKRSSCNHPFPGANYSVSGKPSNPPKDLYGDFVRMKGKKHVTKTTNLADLAGFSWHHLGVPINQKYSWLRFLWIYDQPECIQS